MGVKFVNNKKKVTEILDKRIDNVLVIAADDFIRALKTPGVTPVVTGNLVGSTARSTPKNKKIQVSQNVDYALVVESRSFYFSKAISSSRGRILSILKLIKI